MSNNSKQTERERLCQRLGEMYIEFYKLEKALSRAQETIGELINAINEIDDYENDRNNTKGVRKLLTEQG